MSTSTRPPERRNRATDPPIDHQALSVRRRRGRRRFRRLAVVLALAVVLVVGIVLLYSPLFSARVIAITGSHPHTSDTAILSAADLGHHPALMSIDPTAIAARIDALPFIATATVARHWPDGVTIRVTERRPAAQMAGTGGSWSVLDGTGRILEDVQVPVPGLVHLVVETPSGTIRPGPVGSMLPAEGRNGLTVASTLPAAFSGQVSAVTEAVGGSIGIQLTSGVRVDLGGPDQLHAKYEDVAAILAHGTLSAASVIDVTVPGTPTVSG
ncbi:MAG: cell division protein FtsQ/DivIB [Acidimicrobiales bacterium]